MSCRRTALGYKKAGARAPAYLNINPLILHYITHFVCNIFPVFTTPPAARV
jgi:hypothetical protein